MEDSNSKLSENLEKEASEMPDSEKEQRTSPDQEKGLPTPQETITNTSGSEEKILDQVVEEQSERSKDGNHSDPETGELEKSLLSSIKEPSMDAADNRKLSSTEVASEIESSLEVGFGLPSLLHCCL